MKKFFAALMASAMILVPTGAAMATDTPVTAHVDPAIALTADSSLSLGSAAPNGLLSGDLHVNVQSNTGYRVDVSATDLTGPSGSTIAVNAVAALTGQPAAPTGQSHTFTITAPVSWGNLAGDYAGSITVTATQG